MMRKTLFALLLLTVPAFGQGVKIEDLDPITAVQVDNDAEILFGVDDTGDNTSKKLSVAELKELTVPVLDNVAALASYGGQDNSYLRTSGYYAANDGGGNLYQYHASGRSGITADGGFYINGGGADDYFEAVDKTVAEAKQFGATGDGTTDDTTAIQAAIDSGLPVYFPKGSYLLSTWSTPVSAGDITITGDGREHVTITGPDTSTDFMDDDGIDDDFHWSGVTFDTWQYPYFAYGDNQGVTIIKDCGFNNCNTAATDNSALKTFKHFEFSNNRVTNGNVAGVVIRAEDITLAKVVDNVIDGIYNASGSIHGILLGDTNIESQTGTIIVSRNEIRNTDAPGASQNNYGILVYGRAPIISHNAISNVTADPAELTCYAIYTKAHSPVITGNVIRNAGGPDGMIRCKGINSDEASSTAYGYGPMISNNKIYVTSSSRRLMMMRMAADRCLITGNYFEGKSATNFTVDTGTDVITSTDHRLITGDQIQLTTDGTLPAGLSTSTTYWVTAISSSTFTVSATRSGGPVDITDTGTGTHSVPVGDVSRAVALEPGSDNSRITNNMVYNISSLALEVMAFESNKCNHVVISNNQIDEVHQASGFQSAGVYLRYASDGPYSNLTVNDNVISNVIAQGGASTSDHGILMDMDGTVAVSNLQFCRNRFRSIYLGTKVVGGGVGAIGPTDYLDNTYESVTAKTSIGGSVANWIVSETGSGSPEGVIDGSVGSVYRRTDGGVGTSVYIKQSGLAYVEEGWVAVNDSGFANVKHHGATGDGTTSDTTAIVAAIDTGLPVYFPPGTYDVDDWTEKTLSADLEMVFADGASIVNDDTSTDFIHVAPGYNVTIRNGHFDTFDSIVHLDANPSTDHERIRIFDTHFDNCVPLQDDTVSSTVIVKEITVERCLVENTTAGIQCRGSDIRKASIIDNEIKTISTSNASVGGIWLSNDPAWNSNVHFVIRGNLVDNVETTNATPGNVSGIIAFGHKVVIDGNTVKDIEHSSDLTKDETYGIYVKSEHIAITNNVLTNAGTDTGIVCKNSIVTADTNEVIIANNTVVSTHGTAVDKIIKGIESVSKGAVITGNNIIGVGLGIAQFTGENVIISNNKISDTAVGSGASSITAGNGGIYVEDPDGCVISNNVMNNLTTDRTASIVGIYVSGQAATSGPVRIEGNVVKALTRSGGTTSRHAIYLRTDTGDAMNDISVVNNTIDDVAIGFRIENLGTMDHVIVTGNQLSNISQFNDFELYHADVTDLVHKDNTVDGVPDVTVVDITDGDTTPDVSTYDHYATGNTFATTITDFDGDIYDGQRITIAINDANTTIQDNAGLYLNGGVNFAPGSGGGTITLVRENSIWKEVGRAAY